MLVSPGMGVVVRAFAGVDVFGRVQTNHLGCVGRMLAFRPVLVSE